MDLCHAPPIRLYYPISSPAKPLSDHQRIPDLREGPERVTVERVLVIVRVVIIPVVIVAARVVVRVIVAARVVITVGVIIPAVIRIEVPRREPVRGGILPM